MVALRTVCLRRLGGNRGGELRAGRFFANPAVTAAKIVEGWSDRTGAAVAGRHVLAIQDTTEVKFPTTAQCRRGPRLRRDKPGTGEAWKHLRGPSACHDRG